MAGDIEAFLKMAAERRRQAMQAEGKAPPPQQSTPPQPQQPTQYRSTPPAARPAPPPPRSASQQPSQRPPSRPPQQERPVEVELVEVETVEEVDDYYTQSDADYHLVSSEVSSLDIASHAEHLDDGWKESVTDDAVAEKKSSLAKELLQMLSEPQSVTKAILVSEILRRPDFD